MPAPKSSEQGTDVLKDDLIPLGVTKPAEEIIELKLDDSGGVPLRKNRRDTGAGPVDGKQSGGAARRGRPPEPERLADDGIRQRMKRYLRPGPKRLLMGSEKDSMLNRRLKLRRSRNREAVFVLAKSEVLQTQEPGFMKGGKNEHTHRISQAEIQEDAAVGVAKKRFSFDLPHGQYYCAYTGNGQHLLAGGHKGHIAFLQCDTMKTSAELQVKESIRAVQTLHNHLMFAVAQRKYVYIYDHQGVELHCLRDQRYQTHLDFLPYHYLLVSGGEFADLNYRDISTGELVCKHATRLGATRCIRHNPDNAVVHVGHTNGTMTLWTPNVKEPVVKLFCHTGQVTCCAIRGHRMVTAGAEGHWKVWDVRKFQETHVMKSFGHAPIDVDISMTGLVALAYGPNCEIWQGLEGPQSERRIYMKEQFCGKSLHSLRFRPYEDVLAVGHTKGFASLLVPGAGVANFDSLEQNPWETKAQRRDREVRTLLEKLQPDTIMLDPDQIGNINPRKAREWQAEIDKKKEEVKAKKKEKKKKRGKQKIGKRMKRKHIEEGKKQREKGRARKAAEEGGERRNAAEEAGEDSDGEDDGDAGEEEEERNNEAAEAGAEAPAQQGPIIRVRRVEGAALRRFSGKRRRTFE